MSPTGSAARSAARFARRLLGWLAIPSLLVCAAAAGLWVRSHFVGDSWVLSAGRGTGTTTAPWGQVETWRTQYAIHSGAGRLQVIRSDRQVDRLEPAGHATLPPGQVIGNYGPGLTRSDRWLDTMGFGYFRRDKQYYVAAPTRGSYWGFRVVTLPHWSIIAAGAALPLLWLVARLRDRRRRLRGERNQCPACGYDLRATPGRCPECGAIAGGAAA
jgi:hypothetical protein